MFKRTVFFILLFVGALASAQSQSSEIEKELILLQQQQAESEIDDSVSMQVGDVGSRIRWNEIQVRGSYEASNQDAEVFGGKVSYLRYFDTSWGMGIRYSSYHRGKVADGAIASKESEQLESYELTTQYIAGDSLIYLKSKKLYAEWVLRAGLGKTYFGDDNDEDLFSAGLDFRIFIIESLSVSAFYELEVSPISGSQPSTFRSLIGAGFTVFF